jgi:molybdopterin-guanine dinucleotide biosynthesis protein A
LGKLVWDAVVLAGGAGRRLGAVDKPALVVGGRSLLDTALAACAGARRRVVVGPRRPTPETVGWAIESPPGSGPLAAIGAGLSALPAESDVVVVLAADLPSVDATVVGRLVETLADRNDAGAAVVVDEQGRPQPLLAAYRRGPIERAIAALGDLPGRPVRRLLDQLTTAEIVDANAAQDIDTRADLARWTDPDGRP